MVPDDTAAVDVDSLPPTQYLLLDVLAARYRTGESLWTFPDRCGPGLRALQGLGLVSIMHGDVERTCRASLTVAGKRAVLSAAFSTPDAGPRALAADLQAVMDGGWHVRLSRSRARQVDPFAVSLHNDGAASPVFRGESPGEAVSRALQWSQER